MEGKGEVGINFIQCPDQTTGHRNLKFLVIISVMTQRPTNTEHLEIQSLREGKRGIEYPFLFNA